MICGRRMIYPGSKMQRNDQCPPLLHIKKSEKANMMVSKIARLDLSLEEGAEAVVTTQSSTKINKTPTCPAIQEMEIHLKRGSVLEYLPDPVIAYQYACFKQHTIVQMEQGASLIYADIFTPGWAPDGTLFRYDLLKLKMEVYLDNSLIDHVKLEPDQDLEGIGYMEGFTHFGTLIVINHRVDQLFLEELYELYEPLSDIRIGLSMLAVSGFALRVISKFNTGHRKSLPCLPRKLSKKNSGKRVCLSKKILK